MRKVKGRRETRRTRDDRPFGARTMDVEKVDGKRETVNGKRGDKI